EKLIAVDNSKHLIRQTGLSDQMKKFAKKNRFICKVNRFFLSLYFHGQPPHFYIKKNWQPITLLFSVIFIFTRLRFSVKSHHSIEEIIFCFCRPTLNTHQSCKEQVY